MREVKTLYVDVSAKLLVEATEGFNSNNLGDELIVLADGDADKFEVCTCLIDKVSHVDPVVFFNLKERLEDDGKVTENKYSGLTKYQAEEIKITLKNLKKSLNSTTNASVSVNTALNKVLNTLEQL